MATLRTKLIRLAHCQPQMRAYLLPLLMDTTPKTASGLTVFEKSLAHWIDKSGDKARIVAGYKETLGWAFRQLSEPAAPVKSRKKVVAPPPSKPTLTPESIVEMAQKNFGLEVDESKFDEWLEKLISELFATTRFWNPLIIRRGHVEYTAEGYKWFGLVLGEPVDDPDTEVPAGIEQTDDAIYNAVQKSGGKTTYLHWSLTNIRDNGESQRYSAWELILEWKINKIAMLDALIPVSEQLDWARELMPMTEKTATALTSFEKALASHLKKNHLQGLRDDFKSSLASELEDLKESNKPPVPSAIPVIAPKGRGRKPAVPPTPKPHVVVEVTPQELVSRASKGFAFESLNLGDWFDKWLESNLERGFQTPLWVKRGYLEFTREGIVWRGILIGDELEDDTEVPAHIESREISQNLGETGADVATRWKVTNIRDPRMGAYSTDYSSYESTFKWTTNEPAIFDAIIPPAEQLQMAEAVIESAKE